jgi:hypothetical protein
MKEMIGAKDGYYLLILIFHFILFLYKGSGCFEVGYTVARIFTGYAASEPFESEWWYEYKFFNLNIYFVYFYFV